MFSVKTFTVLILLMLFCLTSDCDAWRRRRRRRAPPPCPVKNCDITLWSYWSYCSTDQCGQQGSQSRSRTVVSEPSCGGTECPDNLSETRQCSGSKAVDCKLSHWSEWSGCTTVCGVLGTQSSVRHRITIEQCGGTCSSSLIKTRSCQQTGCFNGGSLIEGVCSCRAGFSGDCCELQGNYKPLINTNTICKHLSILDAYFKQEILIEILKFRTEVIGNFFFVHI